MAEGWVSITGARQVEKSKYTDWTIDIDTFALIICDILPSNIQKLILDNKSVSELEQQEINKSVYQVLKEKTHQKQLLECFGIPGIYIGEWMRLDKAKVDPQDFFNQIGYEDIDQIQSQMNDKQLSSVISTKIESKVEKSHNDNLLGLKEELWKSTFSKIDKKFQVIFEKSFKEEYFKSKDLHLISQYLTQKLQKEPNLIKEFNLFSPKEGDIASGFIDSLSNKGVENIGEIKDTFDEV